MEHGSCSRDRGSRREARSLQENLINATHNSALFAGIPLNRPIKLAREASKSVEQRRLPAVWRGRFVRGRKCNCPFEWKPRKEFRESRADSGTVINGNKPRFHYGRAIPCINLMEFFVADNRFVRATIIDPRCLIFRFDLAKVYIFLTMRERIWKKRYTFASKILLRFVSITMLHFCTKYSFI